MKPPTKLKYQNVSGTMLARAFSEAIHCTMNRIENMACAKSPIATQTISVVGVSCHQWRRLLRCIATTPATLSANAARFGANLLRVAARLRPSSFLFDRRQDCPLAQPAHADKVVEADQGAPNISIFRRAPQPWPIVDRLISNFTTIGQKKGRQ